MMSKVHYFSWTCANFFSLKNCNLFFKYLSAPDLVIAYYGA